MPPCNPTTPWGRAFLAVRIAMMIDAIARERGPAAKQAVGMKRDFWWEAEKAMLVAMDAGWM